jgi:hypothetical protein
VAGTNNIAIVLTHTHTQHHTGHLYVYNICGDKYGRERKVWGEREDPSFCQVYWQQARAWLWMVLPQRLEAVRERGEVLIECCERRHLVHLVRYLQPARATTSSCGKCGRYISPGGIFQICVYHCREHRDRALHSVVRERGRDKQAA